MALDGLVFFSNFSTPSTVIFRFFIEPARCGSTVVEIFGFGVNNTVRIKIHQNVLGRNAKDNSEKPSGNHINSIISEGFENNNSKPFCNYMKSKKTRQYRSSATYG
jgi:hypothetical protein